MEKQRRRNRPLTRDECVEKANEYHMLSIKAECAELSQSRVNNALRNAILWERAANDGRD